MPVDFSRIPPRVNVPGVSRPSILGWSLLLCLMLGGCAVVAVFVWPARTPDSMLFWFCAVGFPVSAWSFLLCCRFAYTYARVNSAIATNRTSDAIEARCHESSGQPLVVLGHAWRFASNNEENCLDALVDGKTGLRPASSDAKPNTDVIARWLDVPGRQFHAGNALTEHARQAEVCEWLLKQLLDDIAPQLLGLPRRASVMVDLCLDSVLDHAAVRENFLTLLKARFRTSRVAVRSTKENPSLFLADSWFDETHSDQINLLVAVQLRKAVSEVLASGVAEAGSLLLVSSPSTARQMGETSASYIHRPARGTSGEAASTLKLATRWGGGAFEQIGTTWRAGLTKESARIIRSSCRFGRGVGTVDINTTVGEAGVAGAWLAATLAAANAALTNEPQLVIAQEGNDLLALVCEKKT